MRTGKEEVRHRTNQLRAACRRAGMRLTPQRMEIFRAVAETSDHPDAETVWRSVRKRLPTVSLDTVYRTLWLLRDLDLVTALGPPWGRARFDANMRQHHHFFCTRCGATRDFYSRKFDDLKAPPEVEAIGNIEATHVELRGLCRRCSGDKQGG